MAKVTYHPERGAPDDCEQFGYAFADKKPTDVPDADKKALAKFRGNPFFKVEGDEKPVTADTGIKAVHNGGGRFVIKRDGEIIKDGLTKADADAFNALSDEDKAAYVE